MSRVRRAALIATAIGVGAAGCETIDKGQIVLVVQTDMALPKDIDAIRIEILNEGVPKFKNDYERLGSDKAAIVLPASLGLVASEDPSQVIQIIVSARAGSSVRVLREVVTTVPADRAALLEVPLQFLCDDSGKVEGDSVVNTECGKGQTCLAGRCADANVDSTTLADYAPELVFGDGSCFDVTTCFDAATVMTVDPATCSFPAAGGVNVALETEGDGICGARGCFVVVDAENSLGWRRNGGSIVLPPGVCDQLVERTVANVVSAPVSAECRLKTSSLPTCGPWSANAQNPPPGPGPLTVAGAQARPVSLRFEPALEGGVVRWTTAGTAGIAGAVKSVEFDGGSVSGVEVSGPAPRDIVVSNGVVYFTTAEPGAATTGSVMKIAPGDAAPVAIVSDIASAEGIAVHDGMIYWSKFDAPGGIFRIAEDGSGVPVEIAQADYPYRIQVDATHVYWVNEGTLGAGDGSVARVAIDGGPVEVLAAQIETPRALTLDVDGSGEAATALWFVSFAAEGSLQRIDVAPPTPPPPVVVVPGLSYPNGVALDGEHVHFSTRGDGTIKRIARGAAPGASAETLASGRSSPGAVALSDDAIYWIDEGASDAPDGSIVKLFKVP